MNKRKLYENIMSNISKKVLKVLNESFDNMPIETINDKFIQLFTNILKIRYNIPNIVTNEKYNAYVQKKAAPYIIETLCSEEIENTLNTWNRSEFDESINFLSDILNIEIKAYNSKIDNTITDTQYTSIRENNAFLLFVQYEIINNSITIQNLQIVAPNKVYDCVINGKFINISKNAKKFNIDNIGDFNIFEILNKEVYDKISDILADNNNLYFESTDLPINEPNDLFINFVKNAKQMGYDDDIISIMNYKLSNPAYAGNRNEEPKLTLNLFDMSNNSYTIKEK